jgi:hypothetical protein
MTTWTKELLASCGMAASLAMGHAAHAQLDPYADDPRPSVIGDVAFEPEPVAGVAYSHPVFSRERRAHFAIGAGLKSAFLIPQRGDLRINVTATAAYRFAESWRAACAGSGFLARAKNDAAGLYGLGLELRCQPGYSPPSWLWALDLGWQSTMLTHVQHSALARRTFDDRYLPGTTGIEGPRDGWYRFTSTRLRIGLSSAHAFGEHWSGAAALGTLFALQDQGAYFAFNLAQIPFYLEVSTRYAW